MLGSRQLALACDELALWLALYMFLKIRVGFSQRLLPVDRLVILLCFSLFVCSFSCVNIHVPPKSAYGWLFKIKQIS